MKQFILFILVYILSISAYAQKYVKVWSDEFNIPGLPDSTKWDYEVGFVRNSELQYYTYKRSENARIQDTVLIIEAHKESFLGADYTSASLFSMYKGDWRYGKFEISAKVPAGRGTWPAIWMMPTDDQYGGWPRSGEIDIMEYVGFDPFRLHFTLHFEGTDGSGHDDWGTSIFNLQPYDSFNKFSLVWSPDKIEWRLNDYLVHTYTKKSDDPRIWPFNQLFYMILNLAYGGSWGGRQGVDDSKLPHRFYIDYVRIYQLQESEGPFLLTIQAPHGGSVEVFPKMDAYPESTLVTVTALPEKDYEFDKWLHTGSANPMQIEMSKETHLIPIFKKKNELILNGDFYLGLKNWNRLYFFPELTLEATASVVDGVYVMNVTKAGLEGWHISDHQVNLAIEKGASYLITFEAWADQPGDLEVFLSKNHGDGGSYFSATHQLTSSKQTFGWTVKMLQETDLNCKFGFGFGNFTGKVYLDNVSIQKQVVTDFAQTTASGELFELFPNPAGGFVNLINRSGKTLQPTIQLFNLQGQLIATLLEKSTIDPGKQIRLSLDQWPAANGFYLVRISTTGKSSTHPLIINR